MVTINKVTINYDGSISWAIWQNSEESIQIQLLDDDESTPIDLTGYTAKMEIRASKNKLSKIYDTLTVANSRLVIDAEDGKITIKIPAIVSKDYVFTKGYFDLIIYLSATPDVVYRKIQGIVLIDKNVTI